MFAILAAQSSSIDWHRITSTKVGSVPVIGIALLVLLAVLVLRTLFALAGRLVLIGIVAAVLIFFAPALLGKKGAAELHQSTQSLSACAGSLRRLEHSSLRQLYLCSRRAATPTERAQARRLYRRAKARAGK